MDKKRNHLLLPRDVFSTTQLYTLYILKTLDSGSQLYGKQVFDDIKKHFEGYPLPISYSTIYNTLHKMEEENFIISHWSEGNITKNRSTRFYRITDEGRRYLKVINTDAINNLRKSQSLINRFLELLKD